MNKQKIKQQQRLRRKARVNVKGTKECPRFSVFRSLKALALQLIDDEAGKTLVSLSSKDIEKIKGTKIEIAKEAGKLLAQKAQEKGIKKVVFDKGAYKFHGRIKAAAEGAREAGLKF